MNNRNVSLIKTDMNGNKQWDKSFWGPSECCGNSVQQTNDEGYIIAGFSDAGDSGDINDFNAWLIKTDANGDIQYYYSIPKYIK
ncbi:MAG: hypothetical protein MUO26_02980 [Methanotrichaceae archaeon]|nr:hypothetical protein [Methanotrichaceae archaeon]